MMQEDTDRSKEAPDEMPDNPTDQKAPVNIYIGQPGQQGQQQGQQQAQPNPAETALANANIPAKPEQPEQKAAPKAKVAAPEEKAIADAGPFPQMPAMAPAPPPLTPEQQQQQHFAESIKEMQDLRQDIQKGAITPKSYADLTGKGVLDKIGTGFALLLGGMGSGLTHQPNAVLEMMNNEINRDLEAQKQNKANKLSLLNMSIQHEMNRANIDQLERQGQLTTAQATIARNEAAMRGYEMAVARYNIFALEKQRKLVEHLRQSNSPLLPQAEQAFGMMSQLVDSKIVNVLSQAAGRQTMMNYMFNQGPQPGQNVDVDQQTRNRANYFRMMGDKASAENIESKHFQGVRQDADRPIEREDHNRLEAHNVLDNRINDLIKYAIENRGSLNPNVIKQGKQKAEETINFYNKSLDKLGMTEGRLDWLKKQIDENPTNVFGQILGSLAPLREIKQSNLVRRDKLMQNYGIKEYPKNQQQEMPESKTFQGHQYIKVPGGWQKVK